MCKVDIMVKLEHTPGNTYTAVMFCYRLTQIGQGYYIGYVNLTTLLSRLNSPDKHG